MKNLKQNPELIRIEREIEKERKKLMEALVKNESVVVLSLRLEKVMELAEQKKNLKPFMLV